jgi:hypothetical protein
MDEKANILNNCFSKGSDFVSRYIAGETIIVPVKHNVGDLNSIYTLNDLGTRIWDLIDGQTNVKQVIETITKEYEVPEEEAAKDIAEYLESLKAAGLIRSMRSGSKSLEDKGSGTSFP